MGIATFSPGDARRREPWFTVHPVMALSVAAVLFAAVFALPWLIDVGDNSVSLLYALPVSLVAFAFGRNGGLAAGGVAVALIATRVLLDGAEPGAIGWLSRVFPILLLGLLVGASSDRIREARRAERYAFAISRVQRDSVEINDSIVQGLAVAKWLLESGQVERAIEVIEQTSDQAQGLVTRVLGADSPLTDDVRRPQLVVREPSVSSDPDSFPRS